MAESDKTTKAERITIDGGPDWFDPNAAEMFRLDSGIKEDMFFCVYRTRTGRWVRVDHTNPDDATPLDVSDAIELMAHAHDGIVLLDDLVSRGVFRREEVDEILAEYEV